MVVCILIPDQIWRGGSKRTLGYQASLICELQVNERPWVKEVGGNDDWGWPPHTWAHRGGMGGWSMQNWISVSKSRRMRPFIEKYLPSILGYGIVTYVKYLCPRNAFTDYHIGRWVSQRQELTDVNLVLSTDQTVWSCSDHHCVWAPPSHFAGLWAQPVQRWGDENALEGRLLCSNILYV